MLIDEVLAVGDIRFRQKCLRKLTELQRQATYFLASHSNGYISQFCERTLVMEEGAVLFDGNTSEAIAFAERRCEASRVMRDLSSLYSRAWDRKFQHECERLASAQEVSRRLAHISSELSAPPRPMPGAQSGAAGA